MSMKHHASHFLRHLLLALAGCALLAGCSSSHTLKGNKEEGLKLARLLRDQGRQEAAAEVYARLDVRGKLNGAEMLEYATVAGPVRQPAEALTLYSRARDALGGHLDEMSAPQATAICVGMGRAQLALGRTAAAQQDFDCALRRDAGNATALNGMGVLLDTQGRHDEARRRFEQALSIEPGNIAVMNNLALSWLASGQSENAINQLRRADLNNPSVRLNLALAWLYQGNEDNARNVLSQMADASRVDALITHLGARVARLKSGNASETLLMASTQPLALSDNTP
ncbi:Tetratricopeptide TPR_2 repeat protein [Dickeya chrysanthemi Ech1591]|uniref:Tetratricopeptide TPR_2 repeat protein n=1 Tax=Dickeya chrysanthemi (strain Ech1591) TaxID=561229 RepID=C6CHJ3_DICC1|nr:tetratricopeptide repeat protein [Dickeya chrysanthemi]ACT06894.1 Tetratricopeptide TPR_2 repeat protein [Dickeya chrysanthemi Ech1591]